MSIHSSRLLKSNPIFSQIDASHLSIIVQQQLQAKTTPFSPHRAQFQRLRSEYRRTTNNATSHTSPARCQRPFHRERPVAVVVLHVVGKNFNSAPKANDKRIEWRQQQQQQHVSVEFPPESQDRFRQTSRVVFRHTHRNQSITLPSNARRRKLSSRTIDDTKGVARF